MVDVKKFLERFVGSVEKQYADEKARECEELHNAIGLVLKEHKATVQNTLFVFELIRFELLRAKYEQLMGNVSIPEGSVPVKTTK